MKQTGMLVVIPLRGVNFRCLVLLRVLWAKPQYFMLYSSRFRMHMNLKRWRKINYIIFFSIFGSFWGHMCQELNTSNRVGLTCLFAGVFFPKLDIELLFNGFMSNKLTFVS